MTTMIPMMTKTRKMIPTLAVGPLVLSLSKCERGEARVPPTHHPMTKTYPLNYPSFLRRSQVEDAPRRAGIHPSTPSP